MSESSDDERNEKLKFIILGASGTGKSSICNRYGQDTFKEQYDATLGVDFFMKRISLKEDVHATIHVWDLSGMAGGGSMLDKYLYGCHAIMLVYDVSDARSFSTLPAWLTAINEARDPDQTPPKIVLVGNKVDLEHLRVVKNEEHLSFARRNCIMQALVSAKTGDSVSKCFRRLAASVLGLRTSSLEEEVEPLPAKGSEVAGSGDVLQQSKELPLKIPQSSSKQSTMCSLS